MAALPGEAEGCAPPGTAVHPRHGCVPPCLKCFPKHPWKRPGELKPAVAAGSEAFGLGPVAFWHERARGRGWGTAPGGMGGHGSPGGSSPGPEVPLQRRSVPPRQRLRAPSLLGTPSPRPLSSTVLGDHRVGTGHCFGDIFVGVFHFPSPLHRSAHRARPASHGETVPRGCPHCRWFVLHPKPCNATHPPPPPGLHAPNPGDQPLAPSFSLFAYLKWPGVTLSHQPRDGRGFGREQA